MTRIAMLQGHPDAASDHLCHALAAAYEKGASEAGHEVRKLDIARMEFQFLRTQTEFLSAPQSRDIQDAQEAISWAQHLVIVFPLWHGTMPALLKAFVEQVFRLGADRCDHGDARVSLSSVLRSPWDPRTRTLNPHVCRDQTN